MKKTLSTLKPETLPAIYPAYSQYSYSVDFHVPLLSYLCTTVKRGPIVSSSSSLVVLSPRATFRKINTKSVRFTYSIIVELSSG